MVGAINAPTSGSMTFQAYMQNAMAHTGNSGVCEILQPHILCLPEQQLLAIRWLPGRAGRIRIRCPWAFDG